MFPSPLRLPRLIPISYTQRLMSTSSNVRRIAIRQGIKFTQEEQERAALILRDGFWDCISPVLRYRAHNDPQALLEIMESRVKAGSDTGGLILAYHTPESVNGFVGEEVVIGAVVISLPGEGMKQLQKNYGDSKDKINAQDTTSEPVSKATISPVKEETEAERKSRIWAEEEMIPWFNDFSTRSLGPGGIESSLYISLFAVHREYKGKGMGREIMNQVMEWGDEKGWEMSLFDHEPELVKFYSSFGFQEVGRESQPCDGKEVTWWAMKRSKRSK